MRREKNLRIVIKRFDFLVFTRNYWICSWLLKVAPRTSPGFSGSAQRFDTVACICWAGGRIRLSRNVRRTLRSLKVKIYLKTFPFSRWNVFLLLRQIRPNLFRNFVAVNIERWQFFRRIFFYKLRQWNIVRTWKENRRILFVLFIRKNAHLLSINSNKIARIRCQNVFYV